MIQKGNGCEILDHTLEAANKTNTGLPWRKSTVSSYFGKVGSGKDFILPLGLLK